ncbi:MAG: SDR family oxidoreductase [Bacteroidales bacterium]|nr:SDR family oxidoreductase [Bacteroidales bacterium]
MKTVLITGGNRGIGLEICRQLVELGHRVILGSRDLEKGKEAARSISENVIVKQLDVTNEDNIQNLFEYIKADFGKLDVLINNAGLGVNSNIHENFTLANAKNIMETKFQGLRKKVKVIVPLLRKAGIVAQKESAENISLMNVKHLMEINFYGAWRMTQVFIPLLLNSENGRIINMSSGMGELSSLSGDSPGYSLSKSSLNALTIMFSNELNAKGIKVNAMCPGWVKTDMGGPDAPRDVSQGADTAVWLTTEKKISTGRFFRDRKEINW